MGSSIQPAIGGDSAKAAGGLHGSPQRQRWFQQDATAQICILVPDQPPSVPYRHTPGSPESCRSRTCRRAHDSGLSGSRSRPCPLTSRPPRRTRHSASTASESPFSKPRGPGSRAGRSKRRQQLPPRNHSSHPRYGRKDRHPALHQPESPLDGRRDHTR
jgi:hypothetical protein